ncbi:hypothetical protein [Brachybacterium kimchii]|uniref:Uncharacterized protein n=1 Tax=Brachybacterium kimchii TaxID=2942909 RepID=A0ABY4N7L4_9MICO|nr:hypothetical protein [Brachybacterium kimchii]UQN30546.1 hypothetical protein M4486_04335 [Brachybacterium kimchii]
MTTWDLAELPGRIDERPFRAAERADPYWEGMFATGTSDGWVSASQHRRASSDQKRWSGLPASFVMPQGEAMGQLRSNRHRASILGALGAVSAWRTVTREQLACITGSKVMGTTYPASLSAPFSAGLLAHGYVSAGTNRLAPARERMSMWTVGDQVDAYSTYRKSLTFAEHVAVTGGQGWDSEHRFDRHNVLTTELALRVAEFCDVATVLGEKQVGLAQMLAAAGQRAAQEDLGRKADAGIVRHDGLVIAVETTASVGEAFRRKVAKWAQVLQRHPSYELPLVVLVVDVSTPSQATSAAAKNTTRSEIQAAIREAVRDFPGTARNRTASRLGMTSWQSWFPGRREASDDFLELTASFLRRDSEGQEGWHRVRLLDAEEMPFADGSADAGQTIAANARLLAGTPFWLRTGRVPHLDRHMVDFAGAADVDALTDPLVPDRMTGSGFTQAVAGRKWRHLVKF